MAIVEDLSVYFADFGVTAEYAGTSALVILDQNDEDILHSVAQSTTYMMTFRAADFPTLGHGDSIIVDGQDYQVQVINAHADGELKQARLYRP